VGRPLDEVIEIPPGVKPAEEYLIVGYRDGKEIRHQRVKLAGKSSPVPASRFGCVTLQDWPSEVALLAVAEAQRQPVEIARAPVKPPLRAQENQTSSTAANQTLVAACAPQA
jgi:hypothetical protein